MIGWEISRGCVKEAAMGAWGIHAFDNDDACDWASELTGEGMAAVQDALEVVAGMDGEEYLEADLGARALAACEALARLRGAST